MSNEKQQEGYAWHVYHDELLSWCYDYDMRVRHIKKHKSEREQKVRLKRFKFVSGKLPAELDCTRYICYVSSYLSSNEMRAVTDLHEKECQNCTWNGKELVFPHTWPERVSAGIANLIYYLLHPQR